MRPLSSNWRSLFAGALIGGVFVAVCFLALSISHLPGRADHQSTGKYTPHETIQDVSAQTVAKYTEVLAWFTGLLALVSGLQIFFLIRSDKRAADASRQAAEQFGILVRQADTAEKQLGIQSLQTDVLNLQKEIARDQFFAAHRPQLVIKEVYFSSASVFDEVTIEVVNKGQSVAMVTGGFIGLDFVSDLREFKEANGRELGPMKISAFKAGQFRPFGFRLNEDTQKKLRYLTNVGAVYNPQTGTVVRDDEDYKPKGPFYVFGAIHYTDGRGGEFGATYTSVFRRIWRLDLGGFQRTGDPDHEYAD